MKKLADCAAAGGTSGKLTVDLPAGQYLFLLNTASGITALTGYTLNVLEDHVYAVSSTGGSTTGNVMADDILPTSVTATVTDVNGVHVNASGLTTIQGCTAHCRSTHRGTTPP
jgi:hypothetical protein